MEGETTSMEESTEIEQTSRAISWRVAGLETGDEILINDRTHPLTVTGRHRKYHNKPYQAKSYYTIVELKGNSTEYHLLWMEEDYGTKPMLYRQSAWEESTEDGETTYEYPRKGERVKTLRVES